MGKYLGEIIFKNKFVNFKPSYAYNGNDFLEIDRNERQKLLPESQLGTINFYSTSDEDISDLFCDKEYIVFDFELSDLEENYFSDGKRNMTGYKINISQLPAGKIYRMSDLKYYYCISEKDVEGDYKINTALIINDEYVHEGMKVMIKLDNNENILLGPFEVNLRKYDNRSIVKTNFIKSKYIIWGYKFEGEYESEILKLGTYEKERNYIKIDEKKSKIIPIDVVPQEELLKQFRDILGSEKFVDGKLDLQNIENIIEEHRESLFIGKDIPKEIQQQRFETLTNMLTDEERLNDTFGFISDTIGSLLTVYQEKEGYAYLLKKISEDPEFMSKIQKFKIISERIEEREAEVQSLTKQSELLNQKINDLKKQLEQKQEEDIVDAVIKKHEDELNELVERKKDIQLEVDELENRHNELLEIDDLKKYSSSLSDEIGHKEWRKNQLDGDIKKIEKSLNSLFTDYNERAVNISFDGMLSSRMLQQAAEWENQENKKDYSSVINCLSKMTRIKKTPDELTEHLVTQVQKYRPNYDRNTILNIFICVIQGFLTVFSGEPGTGKTSICKIFANVLGLNLPNKIITNDLDVDFNRFIAVSVERGWTTKRDFIGYYNPLTKSFEKSNRKIFDGLNILDMEARGNSTNLPFVILLDEANLSPMEYYWADYMNICDDLDENSTINLGDDFYYKVPNNLRFLATINNDHTTEALSPRLIDRAWIIHLPKIRTGAISGGRINDEEIEMISWNELVDAFGNNLNNIVQMNGTAKEIYEMLLVKLQEARISISARTDTAIRRYWSVAQRLFETDNTYGTDATIVALDYAVAQRILPHINGSGKTYEEKLTAILKLCNEKNLRYSAEILTEIIRKGEEAMLYYQYFA